MFSRQHCRTIDFRQLRFGKIGRAAALPKLGLLYTERRALKLAKVKDLQSLLVFVLPLYHDFYTSIKAEASTSTDDTDELEHLESEVESSETSETSREQQKRRKCQSAKCVQKKAKNVQVSIADNSGKKIKLQDVVTTEQVVEEQTSPKTTSTTKQGKRQLQKYITKKAGNTAVSRREGCCKKR